MNSRETYKTRRAEFSKEVGVPNLFDYIDHWPLYVGKKNLGRYITIYELFKSTLSVPGDIAEIGSWKGANILFLAKTLDILAPHSSKRIHCFDSFEGMPDSSGKIGYVGELEVLKKAIHLYDLNERIVLHPGRVETTFEKFQSEEPHTQFSFVYHDIDLLEPTRLSLECFANRLSLGGLMAFDEWNYPASSGETDGVRKFLDQNQRKFEVSQPTNADQPTLVLKRIN